MKVTLNIVRFSKYRSLHSSNAELKLIYVGRNKRYLIWAMVTNPEKKKHIQKGDGGLEDKIRLRLVPPYRAIRHIAERKLDPNSHSRETISSHKYENTVSSLVRSTMFLYKTIKY